ncbi:MAG: Mth938-like domain-containing protein [Flavobacteriaceae bacterium]
MTERAGFYPGRAPIDAYGNGGFRFAGMSHRGSLLLLPGGIHAWEATAFDGLDRAVLDLLRAEVEAIDTLLVGTGATLVPLAPKLRVRLREMGIGADSMSTGSAARTYNVLLAEGRKVAAALIAVE